MTGTLHEAHEQIQMALDRARKERDECEKAFEMAGIRRDEARTAVDRLIAAAEALEGPQEALVMPTKAYEDRYAERNARGTA